MTKPNFFIIGEPKCGTTIIHNYISQHPDIFMCKPKEPHYFDTDHHQEAIDFHGKEKAKVLFSYMNKEKYLGLFSNNLKYKILGEASIYYAHSKLSAQNIYNFNKDAKIVFGIREPLNYLLSWHGQSLKSGFEDIKNFVEALECEKSRKSNFSKMKNVKFPSRLFYSEWIKFEEHLQRYLDYFPKEQIKVIIYEEFKKDNQKTIDEITDFLGVDRMKIEEKQVNMRAMPKYPRLMSFFTHNYKIRAIAQKILPLSARKKWGNFVNWLIPLQKQKTPELDSETKKELMQRFKPEVIKINDLLHDYELIDPEIDLVKYRGYDKV